MPVRIVTNQARIGPHQLSKTPNGAITRKYTPHVSAKRHITNSSIALVRSRTSRGVASWAKNDLCHLIAPITGYVVSPTAVVIAWAAISPGTMNWR